MSGAPAVSDCRLWLTADRQDVVKDGDVAAAFLLVGVGGELDGAEMSRLGLTSVDGRIVLPGGAKPKKGKR